MVDLNTIDPRLLELQQQPQFRWQARAANAAQGLLGNQDLALALLANSGYSPQKRSLGEIVGNSMMQANQAKAQREDDAFKRAYMQAQMNAMQAKPTGPASVQEYQYATQNGYKGSYEDWTKLSGQTSRPSSVQEWEFYNALPQDQKRLYLEMKRNPNFKVQEINGAQNVIQGAPGGAVNVTPLSTTQSEIAAAAARKEAEARAGAIGAGAGGNIADINTKASDAQSMMGAINKAGGIIDQSTGSWIGSVIDKGAAAFGKATEGAKAGAQLKVLQASLLSFVPKMSGPQSDADRLVYIEAVGQIADTNVPTETRKAALQTVADMQRQYMARAGQPFQIGPDSKPPPKKTVNWADLK